MARTIPMAMVVATMMPMTMPLPMAMAMAMAMAYFRHLRLRLRHNDSIFLDGRGMEKYINHRLLLKCMMLPSSLFDGIKR